MPPGVSGELGFPLKPDTHSFSNSPLEHTRYLNRSANASSASNSALIGKALGGVELLGPGMEGMTPVHPSFGGEVEESREVSELSTNVYEVTRSVLRTGV